jgi:hypothetical protein
LEVKAVNAVLAARAFHTEIGSWNLFAKGSCYCQLAIGVGRIPTR